MGSHRNLDAPLVRATHSATRQTPTATADLPMRRKATNPMRNLWRKIKGWTDWRKPENGPPLWKNF